MDLTTPWLPVIDHRGYGSPAAPVTARPDGSVNLVEPPPGIFIPKPVGQPAPSRVKLLGALARRQGRWPHIIAIEQSSGFLWRGTTLACQQPYTCDDDFTAGNCASSPFDSQCVPCNECQRGYYESAPCRSYANRVCSPCTVCNGIYVKLASAAGAALIVRCKQASTKERNAAKTGGGSIASTADVTALRLIPRLSATVLSIVSHAVLTMLLFLLYRSSNKEHSSAGFLALWHPALLFALPASIIPKSLPAMSGRSTQEGSSNFEQTPDITFALSSLLFDTSLLTVVIAAISTNRSGSAAHSTAWLMSTLTALVVDIIHVLLGCNWLRRITGGGKLILRSATPPVAVFARNWRAADVVAPAKARAELAATANMNNAAGTDEPRLVVSSPIAVAAVPANQAAAAASPARLPSLTSSDNGNSDADWVVSPLQQAPAAPLLADDVDDDADSSTRASAVARHPQQQRENVASFSPTNRTRLHPPGVSSTDAALITAQMRAMYAAALSEEGQRLAQQEAFFVDTPWLLPSALDAVRQPELPHQWRLILDVLEGIASADVAAATAGFADASSHSPRESEPT